MRLRVLVTLDTLAEPNKIESRYRATFRAHHDERVAAAERVHAAEPFGALNLVMDEAAAKLLTQGGFYWLDLSPAEPPPS